MVNGNYFRAIKSVAEQPFFQSVISITEEQAEKQRHMELAVRFLVHAIVPYNNSLDVEEFIDDGIVQLAKAGDDVGAANLITKTFGLLNEVAGSNAFRRYQNGTHSGKAGLVGLEGIAVGVAKNIDAILALGPQKSKDFITEKIHTFWAQPESSSFTSLGLRGTTRIQRTVPFGEQWFRP